MELVKPTAKCLIACSLQATNISRKLTRWSRSEASNSWTCLIFNKFPNFLHRVLINFARRVESGSCDVKFFFLSTTGSLKSHGQQQKVNLRSFNYVFSAAVVCSRGASSEWKWNWWKLSNFLRSFLITFRSIFLVPRMSDLMWIYFQHLSPPVEI